MEPLVKEHLLDEGFAIVRGVYAADEIREISDEMDRVRMDARQYHSTFRHGNVVYVIRPLNHGENHLRFIHWPAYRYPLAERYRSHEKQRELICGMLGPDIKQIINSYSWKTPACEDTVFALHQDSRFRRPASAYRELSTSYVQTLLAIDPHTRDSGCLCLFPRSHLKGMLDLPSDRSVMDSGFDEQMLETFGIDPANLLEVELEPGDMVLWLPDTVHGSRQNRSDHFRRAFINGYVIADNCDRGEWAFRGNKPCRLGTPQLVQFDDLFTKPEPHYVNGALYPYKGSEPS